METLAMYWEKIVEAEYAVYDAEGKAVVQAEKKRRKSFDPDKYLDGLHEALKDPKRIARLDDAEVKYLMSTEELEYANEDFKNASMYIEHLIGLTKNYKSGELSDSIEKKFTALMTFPE